MNPSDRLKSLESYHLKLTLLVAEPVPAKHVNRVNSYREHIKNEIQRTEKKIESIRYSLPAKK